MTVRILSVSQTGYMAMSGAGGFRKKNRRIYLILMRQKDVLRPNYKGASVSSFDVLCRQDLREHKAHAAKLHDKVNSDVSICLASSFHIHELCYRPEECMSFGSSEEVGLF